MLRPDILVKERADFKKKEEEFLKEVEKVYPGMKPRMEYEGAVVEYRKGRIYQTQCRVVLSDKKTLEANSEFRYKEVEADMEALDNLIKSYMVRTYNKYDWNYVGMVPEQHGLGASPPPLPRHFVP